MHQTPEVVLYFVGGVLDGEVLFSNVHVASEERAMALNYYQASQCGTEGGRFSVSTVGATETYEVIRRFTIGNIVFVRSSSILEATPGTKEGDLRARRQGRVRLAAVHKRRVLDRDVALMCAGIMSFRWPLLRTPRISERCRDD